MKQPDDPGFDLSDAIRELDRRHELECSVRPMAIVSTGLERRFLYVAIILNSALYLVGVFIAGLVTNHPEAWRLALTALGVCYISPSVQIALPKAMVLNIGIVALSIVLAVCAGVALFL